VSGWQRGLKPSLSVIVALVVLLGASQLWRPGYSVDEEFTVFAVRGIAAHGLPILPSGMLYDRGLAYSYAGWLVGLLPGPDLPVYRALSLASAAAALVGLYLFVRSAFSNQAALLAVGLIATSIPFWATATTGRFYAPFLAAFVTSVYALQKRQGLWLFVAVILCRWTHELAFALLAIPAFGLILATREDRKRWLMAGVAIALGLAVAQLVLFGLHYLVPVSGATMIRRFFLWQVLNFFERPPDRQFGIALVVMVIGWLIAPARWRIILVASLCAVALILGISTARALQMAPLSLDLAGSILFDGSRYPLDMFWHLARTTPVSLGLALALLVARLKGAGGEWRAPERASHLAWISWVAWFGVADSGITINYLLLPVTLMLAAVAIDLVAIARHLALPRPHVVAATVMVIAAVAADQWRGQGSLGDRLSAARPTIEVPGIEVIRNGLQPSDRVACTDELACLMLVGRVDAWLALDDFVRERFVVRKGEESIVGVYAGSPAVFSPADLFSDLKDGRAPERVLIVDVFKEYPIGNSREWLPRAIAVDGLEARTLLETAQARVVEVSPPVRNARLQP
jgi:hypothetical protein